MPDTHEPLRCPHCHAMMQAGFLPVSHGMHFIRGDGKAASQFAQDLPGTHAIMRSNKLLAWRCKACEMVVFKYGRAAAKRVERLLAQQDTYAQPPPEESLDTQDDSDNQPNRRPG